MRGIKTGPIWLDEANAGQLVPQAEVKSRFEEKRASLLAKLAAKE